MPQPEREPDAPMPHALEPTDPPVVPDSDADVEGSSMLVYEMGRTVAGERQRQAEQAARDTSKRGAPPPHRSLIDRILGR
jgi:hypothetical protein